MRLHLDTRPEGHDVVGDVLTGLLAIQHRGHDAAGVVTFGERFQAKKGLGLVREVFQDKHLQRLRGHLAVGHVRYPTVGQHQPLARQDRPTGDITRSMLADIENERLAALTPPTPSGES